MARTARKAKPAAVDPTASLAQRAAALPAEIEAIARELAATVAWMAELKAAGLTYASEHWRKAGGEPKYLYLVYPMKDGVRPSPTYVGCESERIEEARAGLERAREFDELAERERELLSIPTLGRT